MKTDFIAEIRAETLAATLAAARGRRVRRRLTAAVGPSLVLGFILLKTFTGGNPSPATLMRAIASTSTPGRNIVATSSNTPLVRTKQDGFDRFKTTSNVARLKTDPSRRVKRISTEDLARLFPENAIMVVDPGSPSSKTLIY